MLSKLKAIKEVIAKVYRILSKKQKRRSVIAFTAMILTSLLELMGVTVIIPFIMALMNTDAFMDNRYVKLFLTIFHIENIDSVTLLVLIGSFMIFIYIIKNIALVWSRYIQYSYQVDLQKDMSVLMMKSYLKRPYEFFINNNSAEIIRGVKDDVDGFGNIIAELFSCLAECLTMALIVGFVLTVDFVTSIGLVTVAVLCVGIVLVGCKNVIARCGEKHRELSKQQTKWRYQTISGIKEIFVMQRKQFFASQYEKVCNEYNTIAKKYKLITQMPERIIEVMVVGGIVVIVCVRIIQGYDAETYIPQLGALAAACFRLLPSLNKITFAFSQLIYCMPCLDAVYDNITVAREIEYKNSNVSSGMSNVSSDHLNFDREIHVDGVTWRYMNGEKNILENVSLKIAKGESVALIGESGAGKSTLANIIMGLLPPQKGAIRIDGKIINANCFLSSKVMGYVPQNVYLIDDTIRSNVAFGVPAEEIKEELVWSALRQAKLDEYVWQLPEGLNTIVGEGGIKFSGGQRQRIAIARALYYDPEILVLDEATSALDNETEREVMESIDLLQGKKTFIIIAHRLSTINKCDKIYEVKEGKIIERSNSEIF